jgi:hypothetical protein
MHKSKALTTEPIALDTISKKFNKNIYMLKLNCMQKKQKENFYNNFFVRSSIIALLKVSRLVMDWTFRI